MKFRELYVCFVAILGFFCVTIECLSPKEQLLPAAKNTNGDSKAAATGPQAKSYYHQQSPPFHGYGDQGLWDKSGFGNIEGFLPLLGIFGFAVLVLPILGALFASLAGTAFNAGNAITTATVAGRRRREAAQDDMVIKLIKGFEQFYGTYVNGDPEPNSNKPH